jgi:hypothetical protein
MGQSVELLRPEHRATHYRAMASEVQYLASEAQFDEVRTYFLRLARSWLSMADRVERGLVELDRMPHAMPEWPNAA